MGNPDTGTEMTVKRTKTEAAKLKLLNPEGDITKSDTEFYGEVCLRVFVPPILGLDEF